MILVDSSIWVDLLRAVGSRPGASLLGLISGPRAGEILVADLVLCEVLRGLRDDAEASTVEQAMQQFIQVEIGGVGLAAIAAKNFRRLRRSGITIRSTVDLLLGTWCMVNGAEMLHRDRDFDAMEQHLGLRVLHA